jgi:hypothetical protein
MLTAAFFLEKIKNTGILRFPFHGMFYMQSSSYNISSCDNSNLQVKEKWLIKPPLNMIR